MSDRKPYLAAGYRPWNRELFDRALARIPGDWTLVREGEDLNVPLLEGLAPRFVFFLHWSWVIPPEIWRRWIT